MLNLNLSNEAQYGIARWINSNLDINGTTYPSAYSVEMNINGTLYGDTFAGNFSTDASGAVTGGTVSAYSESVWNVLLGYWQTPLQAFPTARLISTTRQFQE
jgi:hypothetical protein